MRTPLYLVAPYKAGPIEFCSAGSVLVTAFTNPITDDALTCSSLVFTFQIPRRPATPPRVTYDRRVPP